SFNVPRNLVNVSDDYRRLGDLDSSLVYMQEARRWVEASRNERNRAMFPMFEAELYSQMGSYAAAESLLSLAFDSARGSTTPADEARLMLQIIQRGLEMGDPQLAYEALGRLERVRTSLHGWQTNEDRRAEFYIAMTDFLAAHGEFRRAREALDQARA